MCWNEVQREVGREGQTFVVYRATTIRWCCVSEAKAARNSDVPRPIGANDLLAQPEEEVSMTYCATPPWREIVSNNAQPLGTRTGMLTEHTEKRWAVRTSNRKVEAGSERRRG